MIKPNLCDYFDAYILVTGDIVVNDANENTNVAFKNCAPFTKCIIHINDEHLETTENLGIIMPIYNLLEYSDNYSDSSGSLYQFKRDEPPPNNVNIGVDTSSSFKYKSNLLGKIMVGNNPRKSRKIIVPLKYLSNFFRSLEMLLINCKIHLELNWTKDCVMCDQDKATPFKITETKLYVPFVTLSTEDNINLTKQLNEGFKRSVYWNEYKSKIEAKDADNNNVNRLFVLAFHNVNNDANEVKRNDYRKYFLPRVDITKCNVLIDGGNFYDQPISDQIRKYEDISKIVTGKGDDYTTGCLLDYQYFKDNYQLIAADLSKQKELDADPRAIQQTEFYGMLTTRSQVCTILEKSKETILEFCKKEHLRFCKKYIING